MLHFATAYVDSWWPGLIILGLLIGVVTGLFGIGGGFLLVPALRIIFNIPYPVAIGSSMLHIMLTATFSAYKHWAQKNIDPKLGIFMAIGSLFGAESGIRLLQVIRAWGTVDIVISLCFLVLMTSVAVFMFYESTRAGIEEPKTVFGEMLKNCKLPPLVSFARSDIVCISAWIPITLSFFVGCLTGLLGIGGGFINFPLMVYLIGVPTRVAVGTGTFQVLVASAYCVARNLQEGFIDFLLVFLMVLGSVVGVNLGVKLCVLINVRNTRKYFACILLLAIVMIVYHLLKDYLLAT